MVTRLYFSDSCLDYGSFVTAFLIVFTAEAKLGCSHARAITGSSWQRQGKTEAAHRRTGLKPFLRSLLNFVNK